MPFQPNSEVYFLNLPIENDYMHQIYFSSKSEQYNYMISKRVEGMYFPSLSYIKNNVGEVSNNIVRVDKNIDELYKCNYMMYRNTHFTDKWFYCFITKLDYVNNGVTYVHFETDVFQTWLFDITLQPSFVEREHVMDDVPGNYCLPEQLECGEYVGNGVDTDTKLGSALKIVMGTTESPIETENSIGGLYGGIYSGLKYFVFDNDNGDEEQPSAVTQALQHLANDTKIDAVTSLFLAPVFLLEGASGGTLPDSSVPNSYTHSVEKMEELNGYIPRNKKLLTYPYIYIMVTNGSGGSAVNYRQELFSTEQMNFKVSGVVTPGCSIRLQPKNYKGIQTNDAEGLNLGKFPQLNWATDMFTNWLTVNGVNLITDTARDVIPVVNAGFNAYNNSSNPDAYQGVVESSANLLLNVADRVHQVELAQKMPPQLGGNINSGDIMCSLGENTFKYYFMSVKKENAEMIDKFFDMFGYRVNKVKVPNINGRPYWNFVKTVGCNINGAIPQGDLLKFKKIFDSGVTIWKHNITIGDYSLDNRVQEE